MGDGFRDGWHQVVVQRGQHIECEDEILGDDPVAPDFGIVDQARLRDGDLSRLPGGPGDRAEHLEDAETEAEPDHLTVEMCEVKHPDAVAQAPVKPPTDEKCQQLGRVGGQPQPEQPAQRRPKDGMALAPGIHQEHDRYLRHDRQCHLQRQVKDLRVVEPL